jgi:hypothetical protein
MRPKFDTGTLLRIGTSSTCLPEQRPRLSWPCSSSPHRSVLVFLHPEGAAASRVYISLVVFHFTSVLFLSLDVLVPAHAHTPPGLLIGVNAGIGAVGSLIIFRRIMSDNRTDWIDRCAYGAAPFIAYVGALPAVVLLTRKSDLAGDILPGAVVLLLLANIRNAWDLTLVMARRRTARKDNAGQQRP